MFLCVIVMTQVIGELASKLGQVDKRLFKVTVKFSIIYNFIYILIDTKCSLRRFACWYQS